MHIVWKYSLWWFKYYKFSVWMSIFSPKYLVKNYKVWLLTNVRTQTNCERGKYHVLCISMSPWVIQYHCWGMFLHMQAASAETLMAKRNKLADAIKMPPPECRHVYQRKPKRKPGSGLSTKTVYFLNPHTCHVFFSDIITQIQKNLINCLSSFIIH